MSEKWLPVPQNYHLKKTWIEVELKKKNVNNLVYLVILTSSVSSTSLKWGNFFRFSLFSWLSEQTDLKGQHHLYPLTVFICGGPCHLSSFKQCSGDLNSSENSLFIQCWNEYVRLSFNHYLINTVNIKILSLNSFSKPTRCPFNNNWQ